ncbi:hypothetical protein QI300_11265 [Staphylococcus saprophyticus]|nr:hypothetical protein [Staphylococcus saprophyticus]
MEEYLNITFDRINGVAILSYDFDIFEVTELEQFKEDIKDVYGYETIAVPNAKVTFI